MRGMRYKAISGTHYCEELPGCKDNDRINVVPQGSTIDYYFLTANRQALLHREFSIVETMAATPDSTYIVG